MFWSLSCTPLAKGYAQPCKGNHQSLMELKGNYYSLVESQNLRMNMNDETELKNEDEDDFIGLWQEKKRLTFGMYSFI